MSCPHVASAIVRPTREAKSRPRTTPHLLYSAVESDEGCGHGYTIHRANFLANLSASHGDRYLQERRFLVTVREWKPLPRCRNPTEPCTAARGAPCADMAPRCAGMDMANRGWPLPHPASFCHPRMIASWLRWPLPRVHSCTACNYARRVASSGMTCRGTQKAKPQAASRKRRAPLGPRS
jgi:hypothetical protein